jgi:integrase/recombinase XerD
LKLRKHTNDIQNTTYEVESMSKQAKTLTAEELRRVLDYVATRKHSIRNRALVLTSVYSGCRVGELSSLTYTDVVDDAGKVRDEIRLKAENTKTKEARIVFVNAKLKKELQQYASFYTVKSVIAMVTTLILLPSFSTICINVLVYLVLAVIADVELSLLN